MKPEAGERKGFWSTPLGYKTYEHLCSRNRQHAPGCLLDMIAEAIEIMAYENGGS